jgi:hypothetical protein
MGQFAADSSFRYFCDLDDLLVGISFERLKRFAVLLSSLLLNSSMIEARSGVLDDSVVVSDFHLFPTNGIVSMQCGGDPEYRISASNGKSEPTR